MLEGIFHDITLLYVAVATTLVASLYATNGDNLVGLGAKAK
jgi:hypothetical protein